MLTIHEVTSATDAKSYYAASDYYSQGQETVGEWGGKLAETLGLSGKVTKEAFDRMVDNRNTSTGERLTQRTKDNRRVGYARRGLGFEFWGRLWKPAPCHSGP